LMKNFIYSIPDKTKAVYLFWILIHFVLWLLNGMHFTIYDRGEIDSNLKPLFPFNNDYDNRRLFSLDSYDLTDLLVYSITPVVLYYIVHLYKKKQY